MSVKSPLTFKQNAKFLRDNQRLASRSRWFNKSRDLSQNENVFLLIAMKDLSRIPLTSRNNVRSARKEENKSRDISCAKFVPQRFPRCADCFNGFVSITPSATLFFHRIALHSRGNTRVHIGIWGECRIDSGRYPPQREERPPGNKISFKRIP